MSRRPDLVDLPDRLRAQIQAANGRPGPAPGPSGAPRAGGARAGRAGRAGRARGERAEDQVLAACARYLAEGQAWIVKRPTPIRPLASPGPGGRFPAVFEAKAGCDFVGVLAGGRAVLVELKTSSGPSLPLARHGKPVLGPAQAAELEAVHQLGGLAAVLVRLVATRAGRPVERWFFVEWPAWQAAVAQAEAEGAASLGQGRLAACGVEGPGEISPPCSQAHSPIRGHQAP